MFLHTTTDTTTTGVIARRVVAGRYTIHLGEVRIGRVFGDYEIGFTAYDNDGATLGRHESLQDAMGAVHLVHTPRHRPGAGMSTLTPGTIFDTPFEQGCEVITEPDEQGRFDAYDSERVVCSFCTVMVVGHPDSTAAPVSA